MADERPAHEVITALFAKHGLESPPVRLRDELVAHYQAYRTKPEAREGEAVERKADGLAHLVAAISLLKRAEEIGKKPSMATGSKKMFGQMLRDYEGAANRMLKAIYTHPAAPSADKLRIAVEALDVAKSQAERGADKAGCDGWRAQEMCRQIAPLIDQALAALKAEG